MRAQSRELALQILFQTEFAPQISFADLLDVLGQGFAQDILAYTDLLVKGVQTNRQSIDSAIQGASRHWKIERMSPVDKNVMRVAIFEMFYAHESVPPSVAINEAIELVKKFGSTDSASFVNGVLDQIVKSKL